MNSRNTIVALVPTKNEAYIIDYVIDVTLKFADYVQTS